jgi:hypothetical protein
VPQQRAHIERMIGTIRRECLDHIYDCSQRTNAVRAYEIVLVVGEGHTGKPVGAGAGTGTSGSRAAGWRAAL